MRYSVTHITEYRYDEQVPLCHNLVHLQPRDTARQTCYSSELQITPAPVTRRDRIDFFGNHVTSFSLQEPHERLILSAKSDVEVFPAEEPELFSGPNWEEVVTQLANPNRFRDNQLLDASQYTYDSPIITAHPDLADYAKSSFPADRPLFDAVKDLTTRIYTEFKFFPGTTTVSTRPLEVLRAKRGVCQDFAHLQIACLRSLGLAARYVSGYLLTRSAAGKSRLIGADASHAWVSCYIPGIGWVDFDPTNNMLPSDKHVTVGWARDYDDIAPCRGVIIGGHRHALRVAVDVEPVTSESATASD